MPPILRVENLSKTFTLHGAGRILPSVSNATFAVQTARLTALVGPSGAGKSTVLKCIHRTYLATSGRILLRTEHGEVDLVSADERTVIALRKRELSFVTQFLHALPRQPTLDVVARPLVAQGVDRDTARARAAERLAQFNLPERLWDLPPATFSGGEKQRVNLARGLVTRPSLLLLDEPTASLDPASAALVVEAIRAIKREDIAVLAVFHDPELVRALADDVVSLSAPADPAAIPALEASAS